jgi:hypothetical protein
MFHSIFEYRIFFIIQQVNAFLGENKCKHKSGRFLGQLPLFAFCLAMPQRLALFGIQLGFALSSFNEITCNSFPVFQRNHVGYHIQTLVSKVCNPSGQPKASKLGKCLQLRYGIAI